MGGPSDNDLGALSQMYLHEVRAATLNRVSAREQRFQRAALGTAPARGRLLGGRVRTVRGQRASTGAESGAPPG